LPLTRSLPYNIDRNLAVTLLHPPVPTMKPHSVVARVFALVALTGSAAFGLAACSSSSEEAEVIPSPQVDAPLPRPEPAGQASSKDNSSGGAMWGMFGSGDQKGVGVNEFLWRASLDTLHFMPMDSADPYAGVIKTNWYTSAQSPNQRLKVTVFILDTRLRTDALRVSVFQRQIPPTPSLPRQCA